MNKRKNDLASQLEAMQKALDEGKLVEFETHGFSMIPLLHDGGDKVILRKHKSNLRCGDVALCRTDEGRFVLHRVVELKNAGYVLQGDNCINKEFCAGDDDVIGVAVAFIRKGKKVSVTSRKYMFYVRHRKFFLKLWRTVWRIVDFFIKIFRR